MRSLFLFLWCSSLLAVDFPSITGKISNETNLDLASLEISVTIQCNDEKTGNCGTKTEKAVFDPKDLTFHLPAINVGPAIQTNYLNNG